MDNKLKFYLPMWFLLFISGVLVFHTTNKSTDLREAKRLFQKEIIHEKSVASIKTSLMNYAALVSGVRSYVKSHEEMPSEGEFQNYLISLLKGISFTDSLIISYLDTAHFFKYSFDKFQIDKANLKGRSVSSLRDEAEIENLNKLMKDDSLHFFKPINLLEGWIGLAMNFNVMKEGHSIGYVSPVVHLGKILDVIYLENNDFVYRFTTDNGIEFDRNRIYDGSPVYTSEVDPEYHRNFPNHDDFLASTINMYGLKVTIQTAYKQPELESNISFWFIWIWFGTIAVLSIYLIIQYNVYRKINKELTESKQMVDNQNLELLELNKSKNLLFSIVGHDIKGPLNSIKALVELNNNNQISFEESKVYFTTLENSIGSTISLLENLISWSHSNREEVTILKEQIPLTKMIVEVCALYHEIASKKSITIIDNVASTIQVYVDQQMVTTVIRNIISNALKFTHSNGSITISSNQVDNYVITKFEDTGIGMDSEKIENLFKVEKNKISKGTDGEVGSGLGMMLCRDLIAKNDGEIWVESKIGKGTSFYLKLPINQSE